MTLMTWWIMNARHSQQHAECQHTWGWGGRNTALKIKTGVSSGDTLGFRLLPRHSGFRRRGMACKRASCFFPSRQQHQQGCPTPVLVTTCQGLRRAWPSCLRCFLVGEDKRRWIKRRLPWAGERKRSCPDSADQGQGWDGLVAGERCPAYKGHAAEISPRDPGVVCLLPGHLYCLHRS